MEGQHAKRIYALTLGILLLSLSFANVANANNDPRRQFFAGTGFFCAPGTTNCPDIASTGGSTGDKVLLAGSGTFNANPSGQATGSGTFVHETSGGTVIAMGTWTAEELLSFTSFGLGSSSGLPPGSEGGRAVLLVHLTPSSGAGHDAILTITCKLGSPPPGSVEGIKLSVIGGPNFGTTVSGLTVFIKNA